jgi:two-component system, NarL family, invasion response regulator UvrY
VAVNPVRVVIVDDQVPFRAAANAVFDLADGFEVVGEAASGEAATEVVAALRPDLVLMDINLPGINGIEATRRIVASHPIPVIVLVSTYEVDDLPEEAPSSGALAYVHKERLTPELVEELWNQRLQGAWRTA